MSIVVLAPTRGRPDKAAEMAQSFRETVTLPDTRLVLVVDADDPTLLGYQVGEMPELLILPMSQTGDLVRATNTASARYWNEDHVIGNVGDDHRFRTPGWDRIVADALRSPGIAYGDDGYQGRRLPTAVFMSAIIARTLGWYALPTCHHLYIDRAWKTLGEAMGVLRYLPAVSIEHLHPEAGKAEWDEGYRLNNAPVMFAHDKRAYESWIASSLESDMARIIEAVRLAA